MTARIAAFGLHATVQLFLLVVMANFSFANSTFPQNPDPGMTPGAFCQNADEYRYPEGISYCRRNVSTLQKNQIIEMYNEKLGFHIEQEDRQQFKIDHMIPLCAGGGNDVTNLWPQHETVWVITDPIDDLVCKKMADGRLLQKRGVELIIRAKQHLDEAQQIFETLQAM
jgi:hypothetical protein